MKFHVIPWNIKLYFNHYAEALYKKLLTHFWVYFATVQEHHIFLTYSNYYDLDEWNLMKSVQSKLILLFVQIIQHKPLIPMMTYVHVSIGQAYVKK